MGRTVRQKIRALQIKGKVILFINKFMLNKTSYYCGGAINAIPNEIKNRGFKKVFVASDPDLVKFGVSKKVTGIIEKAGIEYKLYSDIKPNHTIENVQHGVEKFKACNADACRPGNPRDTSVEEIAELYRSLM